MKKCLPKEGLFLEKTMAKLLKLQKKGAKRYAKLINEEQR